MDIVRKFASREAAFLMGTVKAILSGESISFELPLSTERKRTVLVQQPWQLAVEGPEGVVLYTTEKLSRRSTELAQLGTFMSVALRHCKPDSGANLEWRSITSGKIQKSKISAKTALAAEAALVHVRKSLSTVILWFIASFSIRARRALLRVASRRGPPSATVVRVHTRTRARAHFRPSRQRFLRGTLQRALIKRHYVYLLFSSLSADERHIVGWEYVTDDQLWEDRLLSRGHEQVLIVC